MYTEKDLEQFKSLGIDPKEIDSQIESYKNGFPYLDIKRAASCEDGIRCLTEEEIEKYVQKFDQQSSQIDIVKFVPASGAASRMFKDLFVYVEKSKEAQSQNQKFDDKNTPGKKFIDNIDRFAFYDSLQKIVYEKFELSIKEMIQDHRSSDVIESVIGEDGLNYGNLPKALIKFHRYKNQSRTPLEEHIAEGIKYAKSGDNVKIHFTVSPEHLEMFEEAAKQAAKNFQEKYQVKVDLSFSTQKKFTDTAAVDKDNNLFRLEDGSVFFRPAGHGSLIENLNDINSRLIFVKTIDNVLPDAQKETTAKYKKALAGYLLKTKENIKEYIEKLANPTPKLLDEAYVFLSKKLCVELPEDFLGKSLDEKAQIIKNKLNRPLRICGMVKNEGEPGGGPFWAKGQDGSIQLQIAEQSQINMQDQASVAILKKATHFNPVDLVLDVEDINGKKFNLLNYIDKQTGFISNKSKNGRELKSIERPGLWNGAMSDWNTIFVEVPIETFSPVKTVLDLLRIQHQN